MKIFKCKKLYISFIVGCILTCIMFIPSFNMDGLCTKSLGYSAASINFLNAGRLITYIFYLIFDFINLPVEILSIISILFSNIFLSIAIVDFYSLIIRDSNDRKINFLIYLTIIFMIYNPITIELFLFDESFVMCMGVMFAVKAVKAFSNENKKGYMLSLLYAILCCMSYQGIICVYASLIILYIVFDLFDKDKKQFKELFSKCIKAAIIYAISLIINFIIIKFIAIFNDSPKIRTFDIISNIKYAIRFALENLKTGGGYIDFKLYYLLIFGFVFCIIFCLLKRKNKSDIKYIFYLLITLIVCIFVPFVVNIAMETSSNYTSPRMFMSMGFVGSILIIFLIKYLKIYDIKYLRVFMLICMFSFFSYVSYKYIIITKGGLDSYNMDIAYMDTLEKRILDYEKEKNLVVKNIYYAYDVHSNFCNDVGFCNSYSYRFFAQEWSAEKAVNLLNTKGKINYKKMNQKDLKKYFKEFKDYVKYDDAQLIFDEENLYLLIY